MGGACSNLAQLDNPCQIGPCVQNGQLLPKKSASVSVQVILTMQPSTHFNGQPVQLVFLKFFINPVTLTKDMYEYIVNQYQVEKKEDYRTHSSVIKYLKALRYELTIYGALIQPILSQHICPFFTRVYSTGYNCTYDNLKGMLQGMNEPDAELHMAVAKSLLRKSDANLTPKQQQQVDMSPLRFCIIASQAGGSMELRRLFKKVANNEVPVVKWFEAMFQVAYGLYVLELAGVAHNDLHTGNVLIETSETPINYCLCIGIEYPAYFTFSTQYTAQIFDFDRANFTGYNNAFIDQDIVNMYSSRRAVKPTQDFFRLLWSFIYYTVGSYQGDTLNDINNELLFPILDIVYKDDEEIKADMWALASNSHFLTYNKQELPNQFFAKLQKLPVIIRQLAVLGNVQMSTTRPAMQVNEQFYRVDASFFQNGVVKTATVQSALPLRAAPVSITTPKATPEQLRNLQVEVTQDAYDLQQLL